MKRLEIAPAARADLKAIESYIGADDPHRAVTFVEELVATANKVAERPLSFPARNDLGRGLRAASHGRYLILFRDLQHEVRIVRVLHGARDLRATLRH